MAVSLLKCKFCVNRLCEPEPYQISNPSILYRGKETDHVVFGFYYNKEKNVKKKKSGDCCIVGEKTGPVVVVHRDSAV